MPKKSLSAIKRYRQSERRRLRNRTIKTALKTVTKKLHVTIPTQDKEGTKAALASVTKALDKAASKGVIHKNTAARRISRLTKKVNKSALAN